MRRLALFLVPLAVVLALAAFVTRWVDPAGSYYEGRALTVALAAEPAPCLISDALIGTPSWRPFKLDLVRRRQPSVVVLGSSRVVELAARPGETGFVNAGMPYFGTRSIEPMLRRIHALSPGRKTVYIGVDLFWFNQTYEDGIVFENPPLTQLRFLLARQNVEDSIRALVRNPGEHRGTFEVEQVAGRCVLDSGGKVLARRANAWAVDGSLVYQQTLVPDPAYVADDEYTRDLVDFSGPYYRDWPRLEPRRLAELTRGLQLARSYGWEVVGFTPPYSARYVQRLSTAPETAQRWREFGDTIPALFAAEGYRYLDLRAVADVPCADDAFVDDGWHPDPACAAALRDRLERGR